MISNAQWLTVREVAEELGVTAGRVRQFVVEERLQAEKFGNTLAISRGEVNRFARLQRLPGAAGHQDK